MSRRKEPCEMAGKLRVKRSFIGLKRLEIVVDTGHEVTAQNGFRYERALIRV
jgi:hypothetical protein